MINSYTTFITPALQMRRVAFAAVVVSTIAVVSTVVALPMAYSFVQASVISYMQTHSTER